MSPTSIELLALKYDRQVPRYTSYPTAPHFSSAVDVACFTRWLSDQPQDDALSLYIHIPFCQQLCWYCGCFTKIVNHYEPIGSYADLLKKEAAIIARALGSKRKLSHIHFGGGSPSILKPEDFSSLMDCIKNTFNFDKNIEIALELDPRGMSEAKARAYAAAGVNRISIGVQDFNETVQKAVNRIQPYEVVFQAMEWLRNAGIKKFNLDLIYGLPFQTIDGIIKNIDQSLTLKPDRISLFGYAHVPWMKEHMKHIDESALPDTAERFAMFNAATAELTAKGYIAVGLDHFVAVDDDMAKALKKGKLQRNFQGYTTDTASALIGIGISSISSMAAGYAQNTLSIKDYRKAIEAGKLATAKGIATEDEDLLRREVIERLMCDMAVDLEEVCSKFGKKSGYFASEIARLLPLIDDDLISINDNKIKIIGNIHQIVRLVCAEFDQYLSKEEKKHSKAI